MVQDPRTAARADQLRPLNTPRPIKVLVDQGSPAAIVTRQGERLPVAQIQEVWRIDDEWWREPLQRLYYRLLLQNGKLCTVYHDTVDDAWFEQRY